LTYEVALACLYLAIVSTYLKFKKMFTSLRKKQYSVIAIKNFEMRSLFDSDSEEDKSREEAEKQTKLTVGTSQARRGRKTTEETANEDQKRYKKFMSDLSKKVGRNYIDCEWFIKSNKVCFLCFLLCILAGAMEYNSVADIPSMAMVLVLLSFYAYRKEYFRAYGQFVMFMAYYMHLTISLKIFWSMLPHIPGFQPYFAKSDDDGGLSAFLRMSMLLFGIQEDTEPLKDGKIVLTVSQKSRSLQVFFMLMVLYCV
jgi:hypothetical protein